MDTALRSSPAVSLPDQEILAYASERKLLIGEGVLALLREREDWRSLLDAFAQEGAFIVEASALRARIHKPAEEKDTPPARPRPSLASVRARVAEETPARFRILSELDVTGRSDTQGTVKDFLTFFRYKFRVLSSMLKARHGLSPRPLARLGQVPRNREVDLVGMVRRIWTTKNGHHAFELEDENAKAVALILKESGNALEEARRRLCLDDVVAVRATRVGNDLVIVRELFWPDLSQRPPKTADTPVTVAHVSDLHVGSRLFLERPFKRFLDWLNGRVGEKAEREEAGRVKYVVVTGDNVDGVGVYPSQYDELAVPDIFEQYRLFSRYILQIPSHIEVFVIPGNHDAVRVGEPQPALSEALVPDLADAPNVHLLGSPSWVELEGLTCLLYHGSALHDLFSAVGGLSYERPSEAVVELLRKRDLMPAYGLRQPFVPEKKDYMLVRLEPDIVFVGDLHHADYGRYRGTTILNGATWQTRTDYQVKLGHVPTPGVLPVLELATGRIRERHFYDAEEGLHGAR